MTTPNRYLVLAVASVLCDECQVIARCKSEAAARAAADAFLVSNADYHHELAIVQIVDIVEAPLAEAEVRQYYQSAGLTP